MREEQKQRIATKHYLPFIEKAKHKLKKQAHLEKLPRFLEMAKNKETFTPYELSIIEQMYDEVIGSLDSRLQKVPVHHDLKKTLRY